MMPMREYAKSKLILLADDDHDDVMLTRKALQETKLPNDLHAVHDGEELMDYLQKRGRYADRTKYPTPGLILLDLNMPKKDGRAALHEIKSDERFKRIPVVVLTTSKAEEDIISCYNLGANSFIRKPIAFDDLVKVLRVAGSYWFQVVEPYPRSDGRP